MMKSLLSTTNTQKKNTHTDNYSLGCWLARDDGKPSQQQQHMCNIYLREIVCIFMRGGANSERIWKIYR